MKESKGLNRQPVRFSFDNSYVRKLAGFYAQWKPENCKKPELLYFNELLGSHLGLALGDYRPEELAQLFSGNQLPQDAEPIAQAYAGHQFGYFNPQLGDGRALIIGEVVNSKGRRFDISFKGSGRTPFSRGGDGKAALGPMLREVLVGEAMHSLGVASTRSLAVCATGESVYRQNILPGAVLTRVAASHIRIGTFEFFSARNEQDRVKQLADYTIARHDPGLLDDQGMEPADRYLEFLRSVTKRQAYLVAQWMSLGFIHGVMNTDNMSIAGETIDYGPCAFMEAYRPQTVFSSVDHGGRYAYQNQPPIAQWNLARLAETLLPLLAEDESRAVLLATEVVNSFQEIYQRAWLDIMAAKLGLQPDKKGMTDRNKELLSDWLNLLEDQQVDFTLAWRRLADAAEGNSSTLGQLFKEPAVCDAWLQNWRMACARQDGQENDNADPNYCNPRRAMALRQVNPWLIPRNHQVEQALTAASEERDLVPFTQLLDALQHPFEERSEWRGFAEPADKIFTANYQTFCGT